MRLSFTLLLATYLLATSNTVVSAEEGQCVEPPKLPPQAIALDIATGNWRAQATKAFITSGVAAAMEKLCSDGKFKPSKVIAEAAKLHPDATYRLLRFLSTFDVCVEGENKTFTIGPIGKVLTPNHPQSVADAVVWEASFTPATVWDNLALFLNTNKRVAEESLGGDLWSYLAQNPETLGVFQRAMTGYTNEESFYLSNPGMSPTFDLTEYKTICDLGSAEGALSLALTRRFPESDFILTDLPEAVARIDDSALPPNFSVEPVNFFKSVPKAEAYILKHVIHDWDDEASSIILGNIKKANSFHCTSPKSQLGQIMRIQELQLCRWYRVGVAGSYQSGVLLNRHFCTVLD
jgi:hypothetical protein